MMRWVRRSLSENRGLKLVSLALALLMFFVVRAEKQSLAQGTVPVTYSRPPGKMVASELPAQLRVGVQGPNSRMQRFRFEDLAGVHIDLSSVKGDYLKFTADLFRLPAGLKVVSVRPAGVQVKLEALSVREVPVLATIQGQVADGYQVVRRWVRPEAVSVRGPREAVLALKHVATQPVSVEGARTSLVQRVSLMPLAGGVEATQRRELEVGVEVAPVSSKVVLKRIPVFFEDSDGRLGQPQPATVDITVSGPAQVLANLARDKLVGRPVGQGRPVPLDFLELEIQGLPKGVKLIETSPSMVAFVYRKPMLPLPEETGDKGTEDK